MPARNWSSRDLDARFLVDSGLLFEINRTILHLFGIALVACEDEEGEVWLDLDDNRSDPEGTIFSAETFKKGQAKLQKFMKEHGYSYVGTRRAKLGFGCQERPNILSDLTVKRKTK